MAKQADSNTGKIVMINDNVGLKKQSIKFKIVAASATVSVGAGLRDIIKGKNFKFTRK